MDRRKFFLSTATLPVMSKLNTLSVLSKFLVRSATVKMPVLFMGHGNPMNAIEDNAYTRGWASMVSDVPSPKAILVISAHWETSGGAQIFAGEKPKMIYDMYGFPQELYRVKYPCLGEPVLANEIATKVETISTTVEWGLDHGAWSVLGKMYPHAQIPCFQLSLNRTRDLQWHYDLAKELSFLRSRGVLIVGSGNINHNLRYLMARESTPQDWAIKFDEVVTTAIANKNHRALINYRKLGKFAEVSVNSAEHFIPLLYTIALQEEDEAVSYANHDIEYTTMGLAMRCVKIG